MSSASEIFKWDKTRFTTHVDQMDDDHEKLINIMNRLFQMNEEKAGKLQLLKVAQELAEKTKWHFDREESLFSRIPGYTGADVHKVIHKDLLEKFSKHIETFKNSKEETFSRDFFNFLKVWLSAHICGIDRKYGEAHQKSA